MQSNFFYSRWIAAIEAQRTFVHLRVFCGYIFVIVACPSDLGVNADCCAFLIADS